MLQIVLLRPTSMNVQSGLGSGACSRGFIGETRTIATQRIPYMRDSLQQRKSFKTILTSGKSYARNRLRPHAYLHTVFEYIVTQPRTTLVLCDTNRGRLSPISDLILDETDRLAVFRQPKEASWK